MAVSLPPYLFKRRPRKFDGWTQEKQQAWLDNARAKTQEASKRWKERNPEWVAKHKEKYSDRQKELCRKWARNNPDKVSAKNKRKYWEDPEANRKRVKQWRAANKKRRAEQEAERRKCPYYRLASNISRGLRQNIYRSMNGKKPKTISVLGCSWSEFIKHIDSQLAKPMTWENYGAKWHIDHIMPQSSFDHSDNEQVKRCWHFTNLRPLLAEENIRKSNKITNPQYKLTL